MSVLAAIDSRAGDVLTPFEVNILEMGMHELVHSHKRGSSGLAPQINKSSTTLSHEVNAKSENHKLGFLDAIRLLKITQSYSLLESIAQVLGFTLVPIRKYEKSSHIDVLKMYSKWHKEIGEVSAAVSQAFADEKISYKEYGKILREGIEANNAFHQFLRHCEARLGCEL
ncbi:MAG: hypothetical protein COA86_02705 [Kangiella sp.]|nr:MAG: hypothetical protein COA86_02705 [Kangiella sp.]